MRKQLVFSVMLSLGVLGGLTVCPVKAKASVQQDQTIKVSGQVVDQDGEALIGATVKIKGAQTGVIPILMVISLSTLRLMAPSW